MKAILPHKHATLTGVETEGVLAGQVVCHKIHLWKINKITQFRERPCGELPHGAEVTVDKITSNTSGQILFHVRGSGEHGWVSGRFLSYG